MLRRSILSAAERESLLALPVAEDDLIRHYTFSESDLAIIRQHRGAETASASPSNFATCAFPASSWESVSRHIRRC
jgi:Domain of unknown function (DUF4158)